MLFVAVMISTDLEFRSRDSHNNTQWKHLALYMYHRALSSMDLRISPGTNTEYSHAFNNPKSVVNHLRPTQHPV
jgi:hypothetical protein